MNNVRLRSQGEQPTMTNEELRRLILNIAPAINPAIEPTIANLLLANERFMVAVDSYALGRCNMIQAMRMAFENPPFFPVNVDIFVFGSFVINTAGKIISGDIKLSADLKAKYKDFYKQQHIDPENT